LFEIVLPAHVDELALALDERQQKLDLPLRRSSLNL